MRIIDPAARRHATASAIAAAAKAFVGQPSIRARLLAGVNHVALSFGATPRPTAPKAIAANPLAAPVVAVA
jgi:tRNA C32,U32 (ribose-2'-O)-methylase TrmJ